MVFPVSEIPSVTELVAPFTSETSTTSDVTPIIIPSIVRNERSLLERMAVHAIFID